MKTLDRSKSISILMITVFAFIFASLSNNSYATPPSKNFHKAGRAVTTLANTIHNGKGVPSSTLGLDGDFYIDTAKLDFYGPKSNGHWPAPVSLRGPAGTNGIDGKTGTNGSDGKSGTVTTKNATTGVAGPLGPQGLQGVPGQQGNQGLVGPSGAAGDVGAIGGVGPVGPAGPAGAMGLVGPSGSPGSAGATGATGANGLSGVIGATGATGATGIQGLAGLQGAAGNAGAAGATGPSEVTRGIIILPQPLQSGSGSSINSNSFGTFAAGKEYLVHLLIYGVRAVSDFASLRINVFAVGGSPIIQLSYLISDGRSYRTAIGENDTNLDVYLTVDGSLVLSSYQLVANISALDNTSTDFVTFNGTYLSQLVGAIL